MCIESYCSDEKVLSGGNRWRDWQPYAFRDHTMDVFHAGVGATLDFDNQRNRLLRHIILELRIGSIW
jgi:hypothetical protein